MRCTSPALALLACAALTLCACDPVSSAADAAPPDAPPETTYDAGTSTVATVPLSGSRDLDLLFVIDNSGSMAEEQASLALNNNRLINVLESSQGGLPSVHIGVVTTDVGAGPFNISGCADNGDDGNLQSAPRGQCTPPAGAFISDIDRGDGTRERNYTGSLSDAFTCIARLGIDGCGFEQPLESMKRALDGSKPGNIGFLRQDAHLAIIFLTDEDDCSVSDTGMFDTASTTVSDPLGPLSSYRCFEYGVQCDPDQPRQAGTKDGCVARTDSPYMPDVSDYVDFVHALKADPSLITVAAISGGATRQVTVSVNDMNNPQLEPSCISAAGSAVAGIRLAAFLDGFPGRSVQTSICNDDLSDALTAVAAGISQRINRLCLGGDVHDVDPATAGVQPRCEVLESSAGTVTELPACNAPTDPVQSTNQPCYVLAADPVLCPDTPTQLSLAVYREWSPEVDGSVIVQCEID